MVVCAEGELGRLTAATDVDVGDTARGGLVGTLTGEGGVVGALTGGAKGLGDGDLASGAGCCSYIIVANAVQVVVDGD